MSDHNLAEALRLIAWSNDSAWQAQCAREALAAHEAEQQAGEAVAYAVYWGMPPTRKNSVHFDRETAEDVAAHIKSPTEVRPLFTHPQQPLSDEQIKALRPLPFSNAELDRLYANIPPTAQQDARSREAFKRIARWIESAHGITKDTK